MIYTKICTVSSQASAMIPSFCQQWFNPKDSHSYSLLSPTRQPHRNDDPELEVTQTSRQVGISYEWALIVCLILICINSVMVATHYLTGPDINSYQDPLSSLTPKQISSLRRPSPYIGLESIFRPAPLAPRTLVNFPQIIAQVDSSQRNFVFDDDPLRFMSQTGIVSPEERNVHVTNQVRYIL